eukprot:scaffold53_cov381-Pavlova_lutheri.AAC.5
MGHHKCYHLEESVATCGSLEPRPQRLMCCNFLGHPPVEECFLLPRQYMCKCTFITIKDKVLIVPSWIITAEDNLDDP